MATRADWLEGARLRTLPAAVSPVIAGSGIAHFLGGFSVFRSLLALTVALALQVGVNYANDYSDGIRGTDSDGNRVGPQRLVGSGAASPRQVKGAAFVCFGVAALAGLVLVVLTQAWWLLLVGAASVLAAWYYTGGKHPYGYAGLGEVFVFVFFGLVATVGTTFVQTLTLPWPAIFAGIGTGGFACAILVANNLRDIAGDTGVGKRTLAVRLGDRRTRGLYAVMSLVGIVGFILASATTSRWALLCLIALVLVLAQVRLVLGGASGRDLIGILKGTGIAELAASVLLVVGLWIGR